MRVGTTLSYLFGDHLGSTSITADASGNLSGELRYLPFGETRYENGQTPTSFRYTGQREAAEIGLYFYGARWYDSSLARFIQADTLIPDQYYPLDWDRYCYVRNNPVGYNDPSGHCPWCIGAAIGAIAGGIVGGVTYSLSNQGDNFNGGELFAAAAGGAIAGALIGSGIGLVAAAGTTAAAAAASGTSTALISAGVSATVASETYMVQSAGDFDTQS